MSGAIRVLCAFLVSAPSLSMAAATVAAPPIPKQVLQIIEVPESGRGAARSCPDDRKDCEVDMKSTLLVTPVLSHSGSVQRKAADPVDAEKRKYLIRALEELNASLSLSERLIAESRQRSLTEEQLVRTNKEFETHRLAMIQAIASYVRLEPERWGVTSQRYPLSAPLLNAALNRPSGFGIWLADRVRELDARVVSDNGDRYSVRLLAVRYRRGSATPLPVHIDGYDTFDTQAPSMIPRLGFAIPAEEQEQLTRDVAAVNAIASEIRTRFSNITNALKQERDHVRQLLSDAEGTLRTVVERSERAVVSADALAKELTDLKATRAAAQIRTVSSTVKRLSQTAAGLNKNVVATKSAFASEAIDAVPGERPDVLLQNFLTAASVDLNALRQAATTIVTDIRALSTALDTLRNDAGTVAGAVGDRLRQFGEELRRDLVTDAENRFKTLEAVHTTVAALSASVQKTNDALDDAAPFAGIDAPQIKTIAEHEITQGRIEIDTAGVNDGDEIRITTQISRNNVVIDSPERVIRPRWFGFHQGLTSGLIFVRAQRRELANFAPEAAAVFRFAYTPRPDERSALSFLRPGFGVHTTTLHFEGGEKVQFGVGGTLHLFHDIVQLGVGLNVAEEKDRVYFYGGLGILQALRQWKDND